MFSGSRVNIEPTNNKNSKQNSTIMSAWRSESKIAKQAQNHPELENLCVINEATMEREIPNGDPIIVDNELMSGVMLPMFRTTDADDLPDTTEPVKGNDSNGRVSDYFRTKKRRFEIQLQIKLKHIPDGQLFFGCELDQTLELGYVQKTFLAAIMSFIQKRNNGIFYNLSGGESVDSGQYEKPHLALWFETSADRFVITKAGEQLPQLGTELYEDPEVWKKRKKGDKTFEYNTEDTYTVAVWSAYVDFAQWKCLNIPAISQFSLSSIIGDQIFRIHWYLADPTLECHQQTNIKRILSYEFGHKVESTIGPAAKIYLDKLKLNHAVSLGQVASVEEIGSIEEAEESVIGGLFSYLSLYK